MKLAMDSALVLVFINFLWAVYNGIKQAASSIIDCLEAKHHYAMASYDFKNLKTSFVWNWLCDLN